MDSFESSVSSDDLTALTTRCRVHGPVIRATSRISVRCFGMDGLALRSVLPHLWPQAGRYNTCFKQSPAASRFCVHQDRR
jgi:hypothetical protein